jgi:hypothetical protein
MVAQVTREQALVLGLTQRRVKLAAGAWTDWCRGVELE